MSQEPGGPHLSEVELAALIYAVGQNRDAERRAYSHLATCAECTQLVGSLRDADRDAGRLLASLDVAVPKMSADSIIRAAKTGQKPASSVGRRVAAAVGFVVVAAAAAAAFPASPVHRWLAAFVASDGDATAHVNVSGKTTDSEPAPAVSFVSAPGSSLEVAFSSGGAGGTLDVRVVDGDQVSLSSSTAGATYRVSTGRISIDQSTPATFRLDIPRSLRRLLVRVGGEVVFNQSPAGSEPSFTIQLTRSNASR